MEFLDGMRRQFVLARVSGIPVRANLSWVVVLALLSAVIAAGIEPLVLNWGASAALGIAAGLVFFLSIFLHEFAHAAAARMEGLRVTEIVLHPFGGLTRFSHEPETPRAEFRIAIAGPAASFLLALVFAFAAMGAGAAEALTLAVLLYTVVIVNFLVAVFNMFPGYPLDGGRVLRAYLWHSGRDLNEATILTGRCGQAIGVVTVIFGVYAAAIRGDLFTGLWAAVVGIFLFDSARSIIREVRLREHVAVEDAMMLPIAAEPEATIQEFVDHTLPMNRQAVFPVARERQLYGMLLLTELRAISRTEWRARSIRDVMRPVRPEHFVEAGTPLAEAREIARTNQIGAVGVIDKEGQFVGMIYDRP